MPIFARGALDGGAFESLLGSCIAERAALTAALEAQRRQSPDRDAALAALTELTCPEELTAALLHRFVRSIRIHQGLWAGKTKRQQVEICWRFGHTPEH